MKIVYVSSLFPTSLLNTVSSSNSVLPNQAIKYHKLLVEGFVANGCDVIHITHLPISRRKINYNKREMIADNGVRFKIIAMSKIPLTKYLVALISSFIYSVRTIMCSKEDCYLVADVLNVSSAFGALIASRLFKIVSLGIVTDLPEHLLKNKIMIAINNYLISKFTYHLFLTDQMAKKLNIRRKYLVLEGHVDVNMKDSEVLCKKKHAVKVCLYAGGLYEKYGVKLLVDAFLSANIPDVELHLYGDGDCVEMIKKVCQSDERVKYFGVVPNNIVVEQQIKSTLLINPRPTKSVFAEYSFPSKNMEYMVSGTPVLTTRLPGMPKEYYEYVFLFSDESVEGFAKTLRETLSLSEEKLVKKGLDARKFVLDYKNNVIQAYRLIKMMNERRM